MQDETCCYPETSSYEWAQLHDSFMDPRQPSILIINKAQFMSINID